MTPADDTVLEVDGLQTFFYTEEGEIRAVNGVSFSLARGKVLALVGESGCGKSVTSYSILRLIRPPGRIVGGRIVFHPTRGEPIDIAALNEKSEALYRVRGGYIAMIFQEPMTALSPVHTVGNQICEAILLHQDVSEAQARETALAMLRKVGIPGAERRLDQYPHEMSGGMRQRVVIAMALVCNPEILIADEPTTALDVTIQAQILRLIKDLQRASGTSVIFITPRLGRGRAGRRRRGRDVPRARGREGRRARGAPAAGPSLHRRAAPFPAEHGRSEGAAARDPGQRTLADQHPAGLPVSSALRTCGAGPLRRGHAARLAHLLERQPGGLRARGRTAPRTHRSRTGGRPMNPPAAKTPLLKVRGLCKYFPIYSKGFFRKQVGAVKAVDDVSFNLYPGETLGLVGESGSGKTTCARTILRALTPTSGQALFRADGATIDLARVSERQLKPLRQKMQMIFQDPFASLNPRMTIGAIVAEPLVIHGLCRGRELEDRVAEMLVKVGLRLEHRQRYPHAFSGGQRQRIGIARALIMRPSLVVADEPVSALDVSVQAQVINLLADLQQELGLTYLFVAHDLSVVRHICDRVAVMYAGKIVELAETDALFGDPKHPYTQGLLSAVPNIDPDITMNFDLGGEVADAGRLPPGCSFHPRCPRRFEPCDRVVPPLLPLAGSPRSTACHLYDPRFADVAE